MDGLLYGPSDPTHHWRMDFACCEIDDAKEKDKVEQGAARWSVLGKRDPCSLMIGRSIENVWWWCYGMMREGI